MFPVGARGHPMSSVRLLALATAVLALPMRTADLPQLPSRSAAAPLAGAARGAVSGAVTGATPVLLAGAAAHWMDRWSPADIVRHARTLTYVRWSERPPARYSAATSAELPTEDFDAADNYTIVTEMRRVRTPSVSRVVDIVVCGGASSCLPPPPQHGSIPGGMRHRRAALRALQRANRAVGICEWARQRLRYR